ncbi:uncharacterized protein BO72DRAFT_477979 [Aspergillus fijiensis CBS 313.89]|uniref:non-specific serine/threonine protein kinase n=1 Tax=Aspergillus fijiensis CBS 313.89 TaxID=1448319 RepID=A0A8G1RRA4_9EURO|nr:uncharacterized protein BO72DRAFT_477979 [Aspergillus fijiensis CBS 313.89]RAK76480.1 hypothetical protein BO72DRAFT_477979 [Aspergillus fijiensis CBS 313.89]
MTRRIAVWGSFNTNAFTISKLLQSSDASSIYKVRLNMPDRPYTWKTNTDQVKKYHDNGDPGYSKKGRDLNRFRCELKAYKNLRLHGVCQNGVVPTLSHLNHSENDVYKPKAVLLEYLPDAEGLNCLNYSDERFEIAIRGLDNIHRAHVLHHDVCPKNILVVPGNPERVVWVDFDVAMTYLDAQTMATQAGEYCEFETDLAQSFGDLLREDQKQGLPPNTKFY